MGYDAIYKFTSYNRETILGYGTRQEASEYCEYLEFVTNKDYIFEVIEMDLREADNLGCIYLQLELQELQELD